MSQIELMRENATLKAWLKTALANGPTMTFDTYLYLQRRVDELENGGRHERPYRNAQCRVAD